MNNVDWSKYDSEDTTPVNIQTKNLNIPLGNPKVIDWDKYDISDEETTKPVEEEEDFLKSTARTALQIPQGLAEATTYGLSTGLWQMLGAEALDPEEIEHIKKVSEREGIPFNEEAYMEAYNKASSMIPTISNIGRETEEATGIPLEPKSRLDKFIRFASTAGKLSPGKTNPVKELKYPGTFKGMTTELPRPVLGIGVAGASEILKEAGLPEPLADLVSFAILKKAPEGAPSLSIGKSKKPSGLIERQFEKLKSPTEVSPSKINSINNKLKNDFKSISDKIIQESPVGETFDNLVNDPTFKQQSRELLNQAQVIADSIPGKISKQDYLNEIGKRTAKKVKGFSLGEYDKNFIKFMKEGNKDVLENNISYGELVEQYRKNNNALGEYFEPGSSKALNRAKRDALLEQNHAIADLIEKGDRDLSTVFKEGNERWTKIMDAEAVDGYIDKLFSKGINFKKMNDFFDKTGYDFVFKRALGEKGYKEFSLLMKDMLTNQAPYRMLKEAKAQGWVDLAKSFLAYKIHPVAGAAKLGLDTGKYIYKKTLNAMLDKPKLALTFKEGVDSLKKGEFKAADESFKILNAEVEKVNTPKKIEAPKKQITQKEPVKKEMSKQEAVKKYNESKKD